MSFCRFREEEKVKVGNLLLKKYYISGLRVSFFKIIRNATDERHRAALSVRYLPVSALYALPRQTN